MRCTCCNTLLTPRQATRRFKESGTFVDMCDTCLSTISDSVEVVESNLSDDDNEEFDPELQE